MIGTIIKSAFGFEQVTGGAVGAAILQGIKRTLFAFSSVVGNYYYGQSNIEFLSKTK